MVTRASIATDAFTGTDGNVITPYTNLTPSTANTVYATNKFRCAHTNQSDQRWNGSGSFTADQYAECVVTVGSHDTGGDIIGVIVRATTDVDGARDMYRAYYTNNNGTTGLLTLDKIVNGTITSLGTDSSHTWANGDKVACYAFGTTIQALINGTVTINVTDSALDGTAGKPGVTCIQGGIVASGDDAEYGNLTSGSALTSGALPSGVNAMGTGLTRAILPAGLGNTG